MGVPPVQKERAGRPSRKNGRDAHPERTGGTPIQKERAGRPSRKNGRDAHPTRTIKIVSYLILIPNSLPITHSQLPIRNSQILKSQKELEFACEF